MKMVVKWISRPECVSALTESKNTHSHIPFVVFKDNGGLIYPSPGVHKICVETEVIPVNVESDIR